MGMKGDLGLDGEYTMQYTDDVLQSCTPETYIILLTNVATNKFNKNFLKSSPGSRGDGSRWRRKIGLRNVYW